MKRAVVLKSITKERPTLHDRVRCLDEFHKPEHRTKNNKELGYVAALVLGRKKPFSKSTIHSWRSSEAESRRQLEGVVQTKNSAKGSGPEF